jgi:NACalpha-BTF3-like transcription factor
MKKKEERRGPTLFDFIQPTKEEKRQIKPEGGRDITEEFYQLVRARKRVSKEEATRWAKERGISTADLIKAIERLVAEKKIRKKLDDEGNLVYEVYG